MPYEQELAQEKVRGGAVDGMWVIRSPALSSLSLRDNLVRAFANSWFTLSTPLSSVSWWALALFPAGGSLPRVMQRAYIGIDLGKRKSTE